MQSQGEQDKCSNNAHPLNENSLSTAPGAHEHALSQNEDEAGPLIDQEVERVARLMRQGTDAGGV